MQLKPHIISDFEISRLKMKRAKLQPYLKSVTLMTAKWAGKGNGLSYIDTVILK